MRATDSIQLTGNTIQLIGAMTSSLDPSTIYEVVIAPAGAKYSPNARKYCWEILGKMAAKIHSTREELYKYELARYTDPTIVTAPASAKPMLLKVFRLVNEWGIADCIQGYEPKIQYECYQGMSTFTKAEMARFIDGVVDDAKELGIETETPEEIERMKELWKGK